MKRKFLLLTLLFFVLTFQSVNAQEIIPTVSPTQAPIQYALPYPGILPSNPLYFLRSARDTIVAFLISNPSKKAEYELLQADKSLQAAVFLIKQKKDDKVIISTLVNAENNFERAVEKAQEAKKEGLETRELFAKLSLANKKHQEVIEEIIKSTTGDVKQEAVKQREKAQEIGQTVSEQETN